MNLQGNLEPLGHRPRHRLGDRERHRRRHGHQPEIWPRQETLAALTIGAGSTVTFTSGLAGFADSGGGKPVSLGSGTVVPEPDTLGLLLVGALGMTSRRRRAA